MFKNHELFRIEIDNIDMLPPVVSLSGPKLRVRLCIQQVATLDKGLPETELIVSQAIRETG